MVFFLYKCILICQNYHFIHFQSPPVVVAGMNPNITSYNVSVNGLGTHIVPAEGVCVESNSPMPCSYSYPVPSFKAMTSAMDALLDGNVAALNEIGRGRTCSPSISNIGKTINNILACSSYRSCLWKIARIICMHEIECDKV